MSGFIAIYDASVLHANPLRNLLMHLAMTDLFRARWTAHIHEEWMRSVLRRKPELDRGKLERTRQLMDLHAREPLITGYESLIPGLELPDPDDRHVLAAAIRARAQVIVTFNLKDFPSSRLAQFEVEAQHPDDFIWHLLDHDPGRTCEAIEASRQSCSRPPYTKPEYLELLLQQGLPNTVATLRTLLF